MKFETANDEDKIADAKKYISSMGISEKASLYRMMMYYGENNTGNDTGITSENNQGRRVGEMDAVFKIYRNHTTKKQ